MNDSKTTSEALDAAVDALLAKREKGQLLGGTRAGVAAGLKQRISDLKSLHSDLSATAIAAELTAAGFPVSASTVQRVLREQSATKPKPRTPKPTDAPKVAVTQTSAPSHKTTETATSATTDAEALLRKLEQENGGANHGNEGKRIATLK